MESIEKEKEKIYKEIYKRIIYLDKEISEVDINSLKQDKTKTLLEKARKYLRIYEADVPKEYKEKYKINIKDLENRLDNIEQSMELLNKE